MRSLLFTAAVSLALAACASPDAGDAITPQNAEEATARDTCGALGFAHLMGTLASEIDRSSLPPRARVITPDMMVTQDFAPQRLNIITGTDGRVSSLRCF